MEKKIVIRDGLRHKRYQWPLTLLSYPVTFGEEGVEEGDWNLVDQDGTAVEFQVDRVVRERGFVLSLTLYFLCSLAYGEEKIFTFLYGEGNGAKREESCQPVSAFSFTFSREQKMFWVSCGEQQIVCHLSFDDISYTEKSSGRLFQDVEVVCRGNGKQEYCLQVRRIKGMPFWELKEKMRGYSEADSAGAAMEMEFVNFDFSHRCSWKRPVERIDHYLTDGNRLPVTIMPYENWIPWFQSKYMAFLGEKVSAGLFIRDNLGWNDGKYPLWGANRDFGIYFTWEETGPLAHFPLRNGERFTGIAVFEGEDSGYMESCWLWYALLHLDKVKNWILNWEEERQSEPVFFPQEKDSVCRYKSRFCARGEALTPEKMMMVVDELSPSMNWVEELNPVDNREFADWAALFDLTAGQMSEEEYDHVKAAFAFMAYVTQDENYMPTRNMLAGHPNFLCDTAAVSGFFGALFPGHPESGSFREYFNAVAALNLQYHIRPDVAAWQSLGGRATENLACYNFAALIPMVRVCTLFEKRGFQNPLICSQGAKWLNWMTNCLSAPVEGRRVFPPQGAHASKSENGYVEIPYVFCQFAGMLREEYGQVAQNALAACRNSCLNAFECSSDKEDIWKTLFRKEETDREVELHSEKFTGYGYILREKAGTPEEISIHIQQLDRGPNYRWGTFRNTGNGGIHYFAAGKRYSYNCLEDTGDRNLGAEEGNCGFAVLKEHTYYNIGFQDLTEPFWNFEPVKQVKLLAEESIGSFYRYRKVTLIESDYIVIYDAVTHMRARGRFVWTVSETEDFPQIYQLKPGVPGVECGTRGAADLAGDDHMTSENARCRSKSMAFDGDGDFLTIVSHRPDMRVRRTDYGAMAELPERVDYIMEDNGRLRVKEDGFCFCGSSGYVSIRRDGTVKGALLEGERIGFETLSIERVNGGKCAVSFVREHNDKSWRGMVIVEEGGGLRFNGEEFRLEKGYYDWTAGDKISVTRRPERTYEKDRNFVRDTRKHEFGFYGTDFFERGEILSYPAERTEGK